MVVAITLYFPRHPDWTPQRCSAVAAQWGPLCCSHHPLRYDAKEELRDCDVPAYSIEIGFRDEETGEFLEIDHLDHGIPVYKEKEIPLHLRPEAPQLEAWEQPRELFPIGGGSPTRAAITAYAGRSRAFTRDVGKDLWSQL